MDRDTSTSRRRFTKVLASASLVGTTALAGCGDESAYGGGGGDSGGAGGDDGGGGNDSDGGGGNESGGGNDSGGSGNESDSGGGGNESDSGGAGSGSPYGGFLDDTSNFDTVMDKTSSDSVTVMVGAEGNDGNHAFDSPAIRVSKETTVQWEWTGKGGQHNVVHQNGAFKSDLYEQAGVHFKHKFTESGTFKYVCEPHKSMGMKGVVEVE